MIALIIFSVLVNNSRITGLIGEMAIGDIVRRDAIVFAKKYEHELKKKNITI